MVLSDEIRAAARKNCIARFREALHSDLSIDKKLSLCFEVADTEIELDFTITYEKMERVPILKAIRILSSLLPYPEDYPGGGYSKRAEELRRDWACRFFWIINNKLNPWPNDQSFFQRPEMQVQETEAEYLLKKWDACQYIYDHLPEEYQPYSPYPNVLTQWGLLVLEEILGGFDDAFSEPLSKKQIHKELGDYAKKIDIWVKQESQDFTQEGKPWDNPYPEESEAWNFWEAVLTIAHPDGAWAKENWTISHEFRQNHYEKLLSLYRKKVSTWDRGLKHPDGGRTIARIPEVREYSLAMRVPRQKGKCVEPYWQKPSKFKLTTRGTYDRGKHKNND